MDRRSFLLGALGGAALSASWTPLRALSAAPPLDGLRLRHPTLGHIEINTQEGWIGTARWRVEGLNAPQPGAVAPDGAVWSCELGAHRLMRISAEGQVTAFGAYGAALGQLCYPRGLTLGPDGLIYLADGLNHRVQIFDQRGIALGQIGDGALNGPRGVAFDRAGRLYVTDAGARRVRVFDVGSGAQRLAFGLSEDQPFSPSGIYIDDEGGVHVSDIARAEILTFDTQGAPRRRRALRVGRGVEVRA
ncbi:NHL repeat-containing protein [Myxococcota bacterium]|nr:NHL repeat-containing protein [Myxococcota bacterium]MBU1431760.1 NHL repeat-containing protein [Myxococcota bacterium]MBU1897455.1 NHL repeat-containing protein [Myxococcota bacterium]